MGLGLFLLLLLVIVVGILLRIILGKRASNNYIYKYAFAVVSTIIICSVAFGIYLILKSPFAFAGLGGLLLIFFAILLSPLDIWLGIRLFKKRTKGDVEIKDNTITEATYRYREKTCIGLSANIVATGCYLLGWVTGIVFILIESLFSEYNVQIHL